MSAESSHGADRGRLRAQCWSGCTSSSTTSWTTASGDAIREHLADCEPCLDQFDVEQAVKALVHRCCGNDRAPETLRAKVMLQMTTVTSDHHRLR